MMLRANASPYKKCNGVRSIGFTGLNDDQARCGVEGLGRRGTARRMRARCRARARGPSLPASSAQSTCPLQVPFRLKGC